MGIETALADYELGRFCRYQHEHGGRRLQFKRQASFANHIGRGTVSLAPTPDDAMMDCVGNFWRTLKPIEQQVMDDKYLQDGTQYIRAKRFGQTVGRRRQMIDRVLLRLSGWIAARGV